MSSSSSCNVPLKIAGSGSPSLAGAMALPASASGGGSAGGGSNNPPSSGNGKRAQSAGSGSVKGTVARSSRGSGRSRKALNKQALESGAEEVKSRLHHLFDQIEKEFDVVLNENVARKLVHSCFAS